MRRHQLPAAEIAGFEQTLCREERSAATIEKYLREVKVFARWLDGKSVTKERVLEWKSRLQTRGYAPRTINAKLVALNTLFRCLGWEECRVKTLRIQRQMFRRADRELTREEYGRLLEQARREGRERLRLLMETICSTGIRVSELAYITLEAVRAGRADISLKGKIRTILLPGKLCRALVKYARKQKIVSGRLFLTGNGTPLSRRQIWAEMKALCLRAGVAPTKVFPHNLRHLFARTYYKSCRDIVLLADVLGHSSVETTRIYLVSTGIEHARHLERLNLLS